ncbi:MAG: peptidase M28, partial [Bacteroidia bacterium]|nr:peptidase M28 [Bacteroidia bacterium]
TVGNFIAVVGKIGQGSCVRTVKKTMKEGSNIKVCSINAPASMPGIDFSDHLNYWKYDYKAIMITNTAFYRNHNYHDGNDSIETLNFDKMAEVVKGVYWTIINL